MSKEWKSPWNPFNSAKVLMWHKHLEGCAKDDYLIPITVDVDPSNRCNFNCQWCNAGGIIEGGHSDMSEEHLLKLADFIKNWGADTPEGNPKSACFTADTKVKLVDGTHKTFKELADNWNQNKTEFEVYSRDKDNNIVPGIAYAPRIIEEVSEILEITLDNGDIIKCTPEHHFMLKDGSYKEAQDLKLIDNLMPLYTFETKRGYEIIKDTMSGGVTHRLFAKHHYANDIEQGKNTIHHQNFNKLDNTKANLLPMTDSGHSSLHAKYVELSEQRFSKGRDKWNKSDEGKAHITKLAVLGKKRFSQWAQSEEGKAQARKNITTYNKSQKGREKSGTIFQIYNCSLAGQLNSKKQLNTINSNKDIMLKNNQNPKNILNRTLGKINAVVKLIEEQGLKLSADTYELYRKKKFAPEWQKAKILISYNHNIKSIKRKTLKQPISVYCLTVKKYHNFALSSGVFVKNCVAGGGESLMNPATPAFLEKMYENGLQNGLITNGSLIGKKNLDIIARSCRWVGFSMDAATSKTYNKIKFQDDTLTSTMFDYVCKNMKNLANRIDELGVKNDLCFKFLLSPTNYNEIYAAAKLAKSLGAKDFHLRPVGYQNLVGTDDFKVKYTPKMLQVIEKQMVEARKLETKDFRIYGITHKFNPDFTIKKNFSRCWAIPLLPTFSADGNVYMCFDMRGRKDTILCKHDPDLNEIAKFWNSEAHKKMVREIDINKCPRCTFTAYNEIIENVIQKDSMCRMFP